MTAEQKKMLRDAILAALVSTAPGTMPWAGIKAAAKAFGFRLPDEELAREVDYLAKRGFLTITPDPMSKAVMRYESTAEATDYCETEGLI